MGFFSVVANSITFFQKASDYVRIGLESSDKLKELLDKYVRDCEQAPY